MGCNATERDGVLTIDVVVSPRASRPGVGPVVGDRLKVSVGAAPVDGAANAAVIEVVAAAAGVPKRDVDIVRGLTGRRKTLRIRGGNLARLLAAHPRD
jgi:uncharacterized protein (TIGR00251 family)